MLQTLSACRYASEVLAGRAADEDAQAYRTWLCHIAAVVTGVARACPEPPPQRRPDAWDW
jgi:hypothetical protein